MKVFDGNEATEIPYSELIRPKKMRVLVACEYSGIVRDAFRERGHDAVSCDLLPTERLGPHLQKNIIEVLDESDAEAWDLMIAHPPCTNLAVSGARWFETKQVEQRKAIWFFMRIAKAKIPKICLENPVGIMSTLWRKPDQYIQPWQFGHGETKKTCLWLKNLPLLVPTNIVKGREARIHRMSPSPSRGKERSITYQGIANAMAEQWG